MHVWGSEAHETYVCHYMYLWEKQKDRERDTRKCARLLMGVYHYLIFSFNCVSWYCSGNLQLRIDEDWSVQENGFSSALAIICEITCRACVTGIYLFVVHLTPLPIYQTVPLNCSSVCEWWIGNAVEGSCRGVISVIALLFAWREGNSRQGQDSWCSGQCSKRTPTECQLEVLPREFIARFS